jgi:hypothetical protein
VFVEPPIKSSGSALDLTNHHGVVETLPAVPHGHRPGRMFGFHCIARNWLQRSVDDNDDLLHVVTTAVTVRWRPRRTGVTTSEQRGTAPDDYHAYLFAVIWSEWRRCHCYLLRIAVASKATPQNLPTLLANTVHEQSLTALSSLVHSTNQAKLNLAHL